MKYCLETFKKDLTVVLECWGKKVRNYDSRRECLRYQQCQIPERNCTPKGCSRAVGLYHYHDNHIQMLKKQTKGRYYVKRSENVSSQKSKEKWDCSHMAIFWMWVWKFSGKNKKLEEHNQDFELSHWEGWGVSFPFQHGGVLGSNTILNSSLSNTKLS